MQNVHDIDTFLLRAFVTLADTQNLTKAGNLLGLSQPAMSRVLIRLRELWGDPLFVRTPRAMLPTKRAEELLPSVRTWLVQFDDWQRKPDVFMPRTLERTYVIGTTDFGEAVVIPKLVPLLAAEAPQVDLVVRPQGEDPLLALEQKKIDVLIGLYPNLPATLMRTRLFREDFVCVLRKKHPILKAEWTAEAFASLPHVFTSPRGILGGPVDVALAKRGLSRRIHVRLSSFLSGIWTVQESDAVITMPRRLAYQLCEGRPFAFRETPIPVPAFDICMISHAREKNDPAHRFLRENLRQVGRALSDTKPIAVS